MPGKGLTKEVSDQGIAETLALGIEEQEKVDLLIQTALKNGGRDNISVMLVSADDDAPVKKQEYDTIPLITEKKMRINIFEKLSAWLKRAFKKFL